MKNIFIAFSCATGEPDSSKRVVAVATTKRKAIQLLSMLDPVNFTKEERHGLLNNLQTRGRYWNYMIEEFRVNELP